MPVLKGKELRIVGFLCNWCSYGGADTAGVARAGQPTDLRIIKVPCSGRVDPLFVVRALLNGADGVLVSGCHPRDCHYSAGNFYARRRLEVLKEFLPVLGIDGNRFEYTWVSASEGQKWRDVVTIFTNRIHALGPAPQIEDAEPLLRLAETALTPLRELAPAQDSANLDSLKAAVKEKLPQLDFVIGWKQGYDVAHAAPHFMYTPEDVDQLVFGPFSVQNLAMYLPSFKGKKVGVVVKGCDARSITELMQEKLINRDDITVFALPCMGTLDMKRVNEELGEYQVIDWVKEDKNSVVISADGKEHVFAMADYAQGKCCSCPGGIPNLADMSFGEAKTVEAQPPRYKELELLDSMSLAERRSFWRGHMERCIRCYACRNACPMCVCRDFCVSESRDPHWMTQEDTVKEKLFFQLIHSMHLAGRCTECGECQRACPVSIPILALRQQISRAVAKLFDGYRPGKDPEALPPLLGYEVEEKNIHERAWK